MHIIYNTQLQNETAFNFNKTKQPKENNNDSTFYSDWSLNKDMQDSGNQ